MAPDSGRMTGNSELIHHAENALQTAAMLGGIVLARAVRDPRLSDEILNAVRQKFG